MSSVAEAERERKNRWPVIAALNAVSTLAQIGQFGIAFILFPLALEAKHADALFIGSVSSALWIGNLVGLLVAPNFVSAFGYRATVFTGLATSGIALAVVPLSDASGWILLAPLSGLGYGLRWIGNETWLFGITPLRMQGRIVGIHESLLGIAAVVGPALIGLIGVNSRWPFFVAAALSLSASIPLLLAGRCEMPTAAHAARVDVNPPRLHTVRSFVSLGALVAGTGGLIEGGFVSFFPVFASEQSMDSSKIAWLLSIFGLGGMLLQFPLGWLVDKRSFKAAAMLTCVGTAAVALGLLMGSLQPSSTAALVFILGGTITGYLTLGIIAATRSTNPQTLALQVSRVSIAFTALSACGPLAVGVLIKTFGPSALMVFAAAAAILSGILTILWRGERQRTQKSTELP